MAVKRALWPVMIVSTTVALTIFESRLSTDRRGIQKRPLWLSLSHNLIVWLLHQSGIAEKSLHSHPWQIFRL